MNKNNELAKSRVDSLCISKLKLISFFWILICINSIQGQIIKELTLNNILEHDISEFQTQEFKITLNKNEFVQIIAEQKGIDVILSIKSKDGIKLTEMNSSSDQSGFEILSFIADKTGVYFIQIIGQEHAGNRLLREINEKVMEKFVSGKYSISLEKKRLATEDDYKILETESDFREDYLKNNNEDAEKLRRLDEFLKKWQKLNEKKWIILTIELIKSISRDNKYDEELAKTYGEIGNKEKEKEILEDLVIGYLKTREWDKARLVSEKISKSAKKENDPALLNKATNFIKWAIEGEQFDSDLETVQGILRKGQQLNELGKKTEAINEFFKAVEFCNNNKNLKLWTVHSYEIIAQTYFDLKNTQKAREIYKVAFDFAKKNKFVGYEIQYIENLQRINQANPQNKIESIVQIGHTQQIWTVDFSPDGKLFATGGFDSKIKLWETESGKLLRTLSLHRDSIYSVEFSPDGKTLATASWDGTIMLWDVLTGAKLQMLTRNLSSWFWVRFSKNGETIIGGDNQGRISFWDKNNGELINTLDDANKGLWAEDISPDGKILVCGGWDGKLQFWDISNIRKFSLLKELSLGEKKGFSAKFSPDGKILATGDEDGYVKLWNVENLENISLISQNEVNAGDYVKHVRFMDFSPDGDKLLTTFERKTIKLWDIKNPSKPILIKDFSDIIEPYETFTAKFDSTGDKIVCGNSSGSIELISSVSLNKIKDFKRNTSEIKTINLSANLKYLSVGYYQREVNLWSLDEYRKIGTFDSAEWIWAWLNRARNFNASWNISAFSKDGKKIAVNNGENIEIRDIEKNKTYSIPINTSESEIENLAFSPDGEHLAAIYNTTKKSEIRLWNIESGKELILPNPKPDWITFKSGFELLEINKEKVIVYPDESVIQFVTMKNAQSIASLIFLPNNEWIVTTPEGFFDGSPNAWKQLIWRFNNNTFDYASVETYFNDFFYPNLLQDVLAGKSPQAKAGSELEKIDRRQPKVEILSVNGQPKEQVVNRVLSEKRNVNITVDVADNEGEKKQTAHTATSGAQDLRLFRNNSLVKVWHGDAFKLEKRDGCEQIKPTKENEPRRVRCQVDVPIIAGYNTLTAYAFNSSNVKSNDDVVSIKGAESLRRKGTLYVLNIGVNDYQGISKLKYAVDDAKDLGAELQRQQQKLQNYASTEVLTLTDSEATKENILLVLQRFRTDATKELPQNAPKQLERIKQLAPEDALLISFSGHGVADGERFYLLPQDYDSSKLKESAVSDIELNEVLEKVDAGQLLFIIDACQSGQALGQDKEGRGPMNSKGLAQLAYDKGMYILTAAQSYQAAFEVSRTLTGKDIKHGLLSFALLEALTTKKAADTNGNLLDRNWFNYAVEEVPRMQVEEMKKRQGKGSELLFSNNDNKNVEVEKRRVQTPRIFYRREESQNPFIVAKP